MPISSATDLDKSATRTDTALLVSALFLQRVSLPYHGTFLHLDLVAIGLILLHQFFSNKILIQYDRLLWFLVLAIAATSSFLLNIKGATTSTTAYLEFTVFYFLFTLRRPATADQYRNSLRVFQSLAVILSCLGVLQFVAQFVVHGNELFNFYGIIPDYLLAGGMPSPRTSGALIKSQAFFLSEPSALSQVTALSLLIEVLEFRRPKYLLAIALGFLTAYSGTGLMLLIVFFPLIGLRNGKAGLAALLVIVFALGLVASGATDIAVWSSRIGEFETPGSSGYARFISPFILASRQFDTVSLSQLLIGSGPGTIKYFSSEWRNSWYSGGFAESWIKILYEYGIIGSFIFVCFLVSCFRRSYCPWVVRAAILISFVFLQGSMQLMIPLCTLSGPRLRGRTEAAGLSGRPLFASTAG